MEPFYLNLKGYNGGTESKYPVRSNGKKSCR